MSYLSSRNHSGSEALPAGRQAHPGVEEAGRQASLAVVFDFDGVLIDSVAWNARSFSDAYARFGVTLSPADHYEHRGSSLRDQHAHWSAVLNLDIPLDDYQAAVHEIQTVQWQQIFDRGIPRDLTVLLQQLRAANIPCAVGTARGGSSCRALLAGLKIDHYFLAVVTADDTAIHKPAPDVFLMAAAQLGVAPERCVVIEDAEQGVEAAHRAGMVAVGFTGYLRSSNEPLLPHADLRIDSFTELSVDRLQSLIDSR